MNVKNIVFYLKLGKTKQKNHCLLTEYILIGDRCESGPEWMDLWCGGNVLGAAKILGFLLIALFNRWIYWV